MSREILEPLNHHLTFSELIKVIDQIESTGIDFDKNIKIGISSNLTVDPLKYYFKKHAFLESLQCEVIIGDYDSHINNVENFIGAGADIIVIQSLFDNLLPSLESRLATMPALQIDQLVDKVEQELRLCLQKASGCKTVFIDRFNLIFRSDKVLFESSLTDAVERLNKILEKFLSEFKNLRLTDPGQIIQRSGSEQAHSERYYYRYKSLYSNKFWDEYSKQLLLAVRYGQSYFYKVIVLDCDNTLWGGIIGEDFLSGIDLNPFDYPGNIFWKVQNEILEMQKQGILLCLCSKNNPEDVEEVLNHHEYQVLKNSDILLKKVNWTNKVQNIKELSEELDLGLDSFIFIDDSDFEIASVQEMLPMVKTFKVPKKIYEYPRVIEEVRELVLLGGLSESSKKKTEQYKQRAKTAEEKSKHSSFEEYLKALEIQVNILLNEEEKVQRISELTQKSNQFNLSTRRYAEAEISSFMESDTSDVFSIHVTDKFGDSGLTGVVITHRRGEEAHVDSFLMSCRVIGRTIEYSLWKPIFEYLMRKGCCVIRSEYLKTQKNKQVSKFYEELGMEVAHSSESEKKYISAVENLAQQTKVENILVNYDF